MQHYVLPNAITCKGSRSKTSHILNLDIGWKWSASWKCARN